MSVFNSLTADQLGQLSNHLSGNAFDVQPVDKDAAAIKAAIRGLQGLGSLPGPGRRPGTVARGVPMRRRRRLADRRSVACGCGGRIRGSGQPGPHAPRRSARPTPRCSGHTPSSSGVSSLSPLARRLGRPVSCDARADSGAIRLTYESPTGAKLEAHRDPAIEFTEQRLSETGMSGQTAVALLQRTERWAFGDQGCSIAWKKPPGKGSRAHPGYPRARVPR